MMLAFIIACREILLKLDLELSRFCFFECPVSKKYDIELYNGNFFCIATFLRSHFFQILALPKKIKSGYAFFFGNVLCKNWRKLLCKTI